MPQPIRGVPPIQVTHKVWVVGWRAPVRKELIYTRRRNTVEVSANYQRDLASVAVDGRAGCIRPRGHPCKVRSDLLDLIDEKRDLDELDVAIRRIPVDMSIGKNDASARFLHLKEADNGNMVFAKYTVEHVICFLEVGTLHCDGAELDEVTFDEAVSDRMDK